MKQARRLFTVSAALVLLTAVCLGQAAKKTYTFRGKVEAISEKAKSLTVNGDEVPGWMGAMTMDYQVDDPAVLKKVKVGDQISCYGVRRRLCPSQGPGCAESRRRR